MRVVVSAANCAISVVLSDAMLVGMPLTTALPVVFSAAVVLVTLDKSDGRIPFSACWNAADACGAMDCRSYSAWVCVVSHVARKLHENL